MKNIMITALAFCAVYALPSLAAMPDSQQASTWEYGAKKRDVVLFYSPGCPYCKKVLIYLKKEDLAISMRNTEADASALDYLKREGGKKQVPCLFINGKAMYESDAIIAWLAKNKDTL